MLRIGIDDYCTAVGGVIPLGRRSAYQHLREVESKFVDRHRRYDLASLLGHLKPRLAPAIPALVAAAVDDGDPVCSDTTKGAELERFLALNVPGSIPRMARVRAKLWESLASVRISTFFRDSERLRLLLITHPRILGFVATGDASKLPTEAEWPQFAREFALVHTCAVAA